MSYLEDLITKVELFYKELDHDLLTYQNEAKYQCLTGCSRCCHSPNIEATVLELLPLAFHLYKENLANHFYEQLDQHLSPLCVLFEPINAIVRKGACAQYEFRPMVCRLFAFSFTRNKFGKPTLLTCKEIKTNYVDACNFVSERVNQGMEVPMATNYYTSLSAIDHHLTRTSYPINEAMRLAIELVMNHFHFSEPLTVEQKIA